MDNHPSSGSDQVRRIRKPNLAERDGQLREVLDGYFKFLQGKNLELGKHQQNLVRWVQELSTTDQAE